MASTSKDSVPSNLTHQENIDDDLEPGACPESILNPTDSFEEIETEMSTNPEQRHATLTTKSSTISEIQSEIGEPSKDMKTAKSSDDLKVSVTPLFLFISTIFRDKTVGVLVFLVSLLYVPTEDPVTFPKLEVNRL